MNKFSDASRKSEDSTDKLGISLDDVKKSFLASTAEIYGLVKALKVMTGLVKQSIDAFGDFEMVKTNLQVVTGSIRGAEKQFEQLKDLASKTPFEVEGLANASIMLQQSGVRAEELTKTLKMLGDVAGGNNEKFNRIAQNYAQILSVGKASSMDMRQFAMAGLPVMKMMEDMGIQGQATAEQVTEMFRQMTAEGGTFYNGMSLQSETLQGKTSTLKDTFKEFLVSFAEATGMADLAKSLVSALTKGLEGVVKVFNKINKNPFYKALLKGALTGAVVSLVTVITVKLVTALTTVIAKLSAIATLEAVVSPAKIAVGLGVAVGTVGTITALTGEFTDELSVASTELKDVLRTEKELQEISDKRLSGDISLQDEVNAYKETMDAYKKVYDESKAFYKESLEWGAGSLPDKQNMEYAKEKYEYAKKELDILYQQLDVQKEQQAWHDKVAESNNANAEAQIRNSQRIESAYNSTLSQTQKLVSQINDMTSLLDEMQTMSYQYTLYTGEVISGTYEIEAVRDEDRTKLEKTIKSLKSQLYELQSRGDWYDVFTRVTGVDATKYRGEKGAGASVGEDYKTYKRQLVEDAKEINKQLGYEAISVKDLYISQYKDISKQIAELFASEPTDNLDFSFDDDSVKAMKAYFEELKGYLKEMGVDIDELNGVIEEEESKVEEAKLFDVEAYKKMLEKARTDSSKLNEMFGTDVFDIQDLIKQQREGVVAQIQQLLQEKDEEGKLLYTTESQQVKDLISLYGELGSLIVDVAEEVEEAEEVLTLKDYVKGRGKELASGLVQGSDVGNFLQGMEEGGVWGGVINMFLTALTDIVGGLEGLNLILSPIKEMLKELAPTIKALLLPLLVVGKAIALLGKGIQWLLNFLTFGLIDKMAEQWDNLVTESSELSSNTKEVNKNMSGLVQSLHELMDAIDKQEQYYLSEKMNLMAQNRYATPVNDMILTPKGTFSTNPRDTIIATQNPRGLSGINVQINNSQAGNVDVTARQDNYGNLVIDISKKVASDFASGKNGWNEAVNYRDIKSMGRRLS